MKRTLITGLGAVLMTGLMSVTPAQADTDPTYKFAQHLSGRCLVVPNPAWPTVELGSCDSSYARWRYYDGTRQLHNIGTNRCLEADGRKVTVQICNRDVADQRNWNVGSGPTPDLGSIVKEYATSDSYRLLTGWTSGNSVSLKTIADLQGKPQNYLFWLRG
jgi:hypothetical protein